MSPKIILTFALSLCACGPGLAIDYGDTGPWDDDAGDADSGGSETGVPVDMGGDVDPCEPGTADSGARRSFVEFECMSSGCHGRWTCSDDWSHILQGGEVSALPSADPSVLWPCEPMPDVDGCFVIDAAAHVGCFRFYGTWAVAVAPACAIGPSTDWIDVGSGMVANVD